MVRRASCGLQRAAGIRVARSHTRLQRSADHAEAPLRTTQPDPAFLATPGSAFTRDEATPGSEVAVKFDAPHPTYFHGIVRRCRERNARVLFADGEDRPQNTRMHACHANAG